MSAAPYDVLAHFGHPDQEDVRLVEVAGHQRLWVAVEEPRALDSTQLVVLMQLGVHYIAVEHDGRVVEFDLREIIVRAVSPLTAVER